jgi:hypothetical protein
VGCEVGAGSQNTPPNGELWLRTVLGFQQGADGEFRVELVNEYTSMLSRKCPTALSMCTEHEQLKGQILAEIDGDRDIGRKCRELQAAWKQGAELSIVLTLGRNHTAKEHHAGRALPYFRGAHSPYGVILV